MRIKLGIPMTINEIAGATNGKVLSKGTELVEYISTDSRECQRGDLFIPIKGSRFDGENFVEEAIKKGVFVISTRSDLAQIKTADSVGALLNLASFYLKKLPYLLYKVGVTGSVGKTTTKEFSRVILSKHYNVHANHGNFNNKIGLPMSILSAKKSCQVLIAEMGMNHIGEICILSKCLCPNLAVITNIGTSHIGNLGSKEAIANAKLEISKGMSDGKIIVPKEENLLKNCKNKTTISITDSEADYYLHSQENVVSIYKNGIKFTEAEFAFKEEYLKKCLLSACAIAIESGISPCSLSAGISSISSDNLRQNIVNAGGYIFLNDSYNASLESIVASFDSVRHLQKYGKKSLMLGDVLELGDMSEEIHNQIGSCISPKLFNHIFLFGSFAKHTAEGAIKSGFPVERIHINEATDLPHISALQIKHFCSLGELILIKGSRGVRMERILDFFEKE